MPALPDRVVIVAELTAELLHDIRTAQQSDPELHVVERGDSVDDEEAFC